MNGNQEVFRRIEKKYIVDEPTYEKLIKKLDGHFVKDRYYKSTICNIYYDTPSHQLASPTRHCWRRPAASCRG